MTDYETELQRIRHELRDLAEDLGPASANTAIAWGELVPAKCSLGRNIRVTRLDLAAEFLGVLCERDQLLDRIRLYRAINLPNKILDEKVESLAQRFLDDDSLIKELRQRLRRDAADRLRGAHFEYRDLPPSETAEGDDADALCDHLFHESVEAERELLLTNRLGGTQSFEPELKRLVLEGASALQESMMRGLSAGGFKALARWLRAYGRCTLNYPWPSHSDSLSPIQYLHTLMKNHESYPYGWLRQLSNDPEYAGLGPDLFGIWNELAELFGQIDFDDLVEDLQHGIPPFSPGGNDQINIVPGDRKVACKPVLLALARGGGKSGKFAFENVMRAVKEHLIECQDILKLVVFVTDTWDSRKFLEDHFGELASWRRRNIRFLFLGVGAPRDQMAPIAVDLS
jgi:hypothetical protein